MDLAVRYVVEASDALTESAPNQPARWIRQGVDSEIVMRMTKARLAIVLLALLAAGLQVLGPPDVLAQPPAAGMVAEPCLPPPEQTPALRALLSELFFDSRPLTPMDLERLENHPDLVAFNRINRQRAQQDWAGLCRYHFSNAELPIPELPRIVFMGDSITENWVLADPELFSGGNVGRGIGGQTSAQMLLRFRRDVVALRPSAVHIVAGTNDIAGNTGPTSPQDLKDNIMSMAEIARANGISVILGSIPPAAGFSWRPEVEPGPFIVEINAWMRDYAVRNGFAYIDYYTVLVGTQGELRADLGNDGVHPNRAGYALMRRSFEAEITSMRLAEIER
jgi:lysophospholipase L1-like esterase